jgi:tRNA(Ile2) C34 agmatinyltransferase TiaS
VRKVKKKKLRRIVEEEGRERCVKKINVLSLEGPMGRGLVGVYASVGAKVPDHVIIPDNNPLTLSLPRPRKRLEYSVL